MDGKRLRSSITKLRPLHLFSGVLLYVMGVGIGDYLGFTIYPGAFFLGWIWVLTLQLGMITLGDYMGTPLDVGLLHRRPFSPSAEEGGQESKKERSILLSALFLALTAACTVLMELSRPLTAPVILLMAALTASYVVQIWPSLDFERTGLRELLTTIQLVVILPALGFTLQTGLYHRFLGLTTFPLFSLHVAMLFVFQLPSYGSDVSQRRHTAMTEMGWQNGIFLHNMLVIFAYLMLGISLFLGYPPRLVYPVLLTLPFGAFQVWSLYRLTQGAPTRWKLLMLVSTVLFLLPTYLFTYSFWTQ